MLEIHRLPGHLIRRLHQISSAVFAERMAAEGYDLTPVQYAALAAIEAEPEIDQATLAGLIAYDRVTIGGAIDRLEQKGLVSRAVSQHDRRARVLRLSPAGAKTLRELRPIIHALQDDILIGLSAAEKETFLRLIAKATEAGNALSRAPLQARTSA
jgi:DNA-binding MarR family transcriptional regulator